MNRNRFVSILTALCCTLSSFAAMPVLAEDTPTKELPTTGIIDIIESVYEGPADSGYIGYMTYPGGADLNSLQIADYLTDGSAMPALGDVINYSYVSADFSSPAQIHFGEDSYVTTLGPVWEYFDGRVELTVTEFEMQTYDTEQHYEFLDPLTGRTYSKTYYDGWEHGFGTEPMQVGDVVTYVTDEKGNLLYPLSVERLGDANADGAVSIVDVVMVNRYVMGADTARSVMNTKSADFDGNGEVTHEDSLSILKRLVGLV